jgi:protein-ribulosamine 3-kinase
VTAALPDGLTQPLEQALERITGRPTRLTQARPLGGGCINPSARIDTDRGERFFVKWNARPPAGMFGAEADGLLALANARALRVPAVVAVGGAWPSGLEWLLLEHIETGRPASDYAERLGTGLAAMHRSGAGAEPPWGWPQDNFIGSLPQSNATAPSWGEFWRDARLRPQLERARAAGHFGGKDGALVDRSVERTPELLANVDDPPSLLHGDLWGGNVLTDADGRPVLIDPAVYRGHREVDLAMSELFGGFPAGWADGYDDAWPLDAGYAHHRRALYQLYYLLVHVNLFGGVYEAGCVRAAKEALRG